jgi:hypothetical protein
VRDVLEREAASLWHWEPSKRRGVVWVSMAAAATFKIHRSSWVRDKTLSSGSSRTVVVQKR